MSDPFEMSQNIVHCMSTESARGTQLNMPSRPPMWRHTTTPELTLMLRHGLRRCTCASAPAQAVLDFTIPYHDEAPLGLGPGPEAEAEDIIAAPTHASLIGCTLGSRSLSLPGRS